MTHIKELNPDNWDQFWQKNLGKGYRNYHQDMLDKLIEIIDVNNKQILEIGGAGSISLSLAQAGAHVYLLDFSTMAVQNAHQLASQTPFVVMQANAYQIPIADQSFDIVLHQGFLEHFTTPGILMAEQYRVLRKGGLILVDVPQRYNFYAVKKRIDMLLDRWSAGWETDFTYPGLKSLLEKTGFDTVKAYGRWYYPSLFYCIRHLQRAEHKLGKKFASEGLWIRYEQFWQRFENSQLSLYLLMNVGVIARKPD